MRLLIQRVSAASVTIDGRVKSSISQGLLLLVGFEETDEKEDIDFMCKKTIYLRIFDDENGVMNRSVLDIGGEILVVSQFTLFASTKKEIVPHISVLQTRYLHSALRTVLCNLVGNAGKTGANW